MRRDEGEMHLDADAAARIVRVSGIDKGAAMFRKAFESLNRRCAACSRITLVLGVALLVLLVGGILMTAGAAGLAWTNTERFCISCHEMRDNVFAEFKGTVHDVNRSGVRAICSDCHVPREPLPLLKRKVAATFELWGKLTGKIDTKEKFEAHRYELARRVWTTMLETDSRECRNCHRSDAMDLQKQSQRARNSHEKAAAGGATCIVCHYGIAHDEPDGPPPDELVVTARQ